MGVILNGVDQYGLINHPAMAMSPSGYNAAVGIRFKVATKGATNHYLISNGEIAASTLNIFYQEDGTNAGLVSLYWSTFSGLGKATMPADFIDGTTEYWVITERIGTSCYIWFCKAGGTATRVSCGTVSSANIVGDRDWYFGTRGDLNVDRFAKGELSGLIKINTEENELTAAQVEALANSGTLPPNTAVYMPFDEGSGATASDTVNDPAVEMALFGSPTWTGAPTVTPISFTGSIPNQTFTAGDVVSEDLSPFFSGTETPFTFANTGTALAGSGLALSSAGVLSGAATESSITGVIVTGTDTATDTASSNAFNITVSAVAQVPQGTVTIGTITVTDTTASVPFSYDGSDQTGFEFRFDGGSALTAPTNPLEFSSLTPETPYTVEVRAINATGPGAWSAAGNFTTDATPVVTATFVSEPLKDTTGELNSLLANEPLDYVALYDPVTHGLVLVATGLSTDANGQFTVTDAALTAAVNYKADWKLTSQAMGRMPAKAAV